ncbi:hypothetical protein BH11CYA1_BH11CYA1_48950 [soil metagenome]
MGMAITYVGIKGKPDADLLKSLEVNDAGSAGLDCDYENEIAGIAANENWYLLIKYGNGEALQRAELLAALSKNTRLVVSEVEEHVMFSASFGWENGREVWSIVHDSQAGEEHLAIKGAVPAGCAEIARFSLKKQEEENDCDYIFEIPIELARNIHGFRYDGNASGPDIAVNF